MSLAVTYLEGWLLAHPVPVLIFLACAGTLAVLAAVMWAEERRDGRGAGLPQAPRRDPPRSRAGGTRARRQVTVRACRRAGTILARGSGRARQAIARRARGIT